MFTGRLYLEEGCVLLHSSKRSWISAGHIMIEQGKNLERSQRNRVAAKLSSCKEDLFHEYTMLRNLGEITTGDSFVRVMNFLEPGLISGTDFTDQYYALVMERGCYDLGMFLHDETPLPNDVKKDVIDQITAIVASINDAGYVWNDVKPGNFVYIRRENKWKGIDVEGAQEAGAQLQQSSCVTLRFACPEVARACKYHSIGGMQASAQMDAWSLGMTLLCIFTENGMNYFDFNNLCSNPEIINHLCSKNCQRFIDRFIEHTITDQTCELEKQLVHELLCVDYQTRKTAAEVRTACTVQP